MSAPEIVVLCGSTRFYDEFQEANYRLTMEGRIVLSVGFYPHARAQHGHGEGVGHDSAEKVALDELHLRKIDLADRVYVINPGGYVGASTHREIAYARRVGKPVDYLVPPSQNVEQIVRAALGFLGPGQPGALVQCRDSDTLPGTVLLHIGSRSSALVVERPLMAHGYRVDPGPPCTYGVTFLVERSTCLACPPDCGSCGGDQDCECYEHQDVPQPTPPAEIPVRALPEPIEPQDGDVWHDNCPGSTGGQLWHARRDQDGRVELYEKGGPGLVRADAVASMRGGMTLIERGGKPAPSAPCISWENFMGDRDDMNTTHLVGPFLNPADRDAELARLRALPLGAPEFNGGALFHAGTWEEAHGAQGWDFHVVPPSQVAQARTLRGFFAAFHGYQEEVLVTSFGYGHDPAPAAELVIDVRASLRNPHDDPAMRELTGRDTTVREHVMATPGAAELVADVVAKVLNGEVATVAVGCVGGRHRSVALADEIGAMLREKGREVEVVHRDIYQPVLSSAVHTPTDGTISE